MTDLTNLVLVRVDDRLIHGQVMTAWLKVVPAREVLVVDDETAKDEFLAEILKAAAPSDLKVHVLSTADAIMRLRDQGLPNRTFLLVKSPLTLKEIYDAGVPLTAINVGGMGMRPGRKVVYKNVSASEEERQAFRDLIAQGVKVTLQIVPAERSFDLQGMLK